MPESSRASEQDEDAVFTVGPPYPVTDSRLLPAVTAQEEADVVSGADLGPEHPDNAHGDLGIDQAIDPAVGEATAMGIDDDLPGEDELDELVADLDPDDVDDVGLDNADLSGLPEGLSDGRRLTQPRQDRERRAVIAATLTTKQAKSMLLAIGFDNADDDFRVAVEGFQAGWNLGTALAVDGIVGPFTSAALSTSFARHRQGKSTMSAHFSYVEFRCKDGGAFPECRRIWELRTQVRRLEAYRAHSDAPVRIVSGCRCRRYNARIGGATLSQHLYGAAADIIGVLSLSRVKDLELFAGLGYDGSTGKVIHVDSRDKSGHNTTGGTPTHPTSWEYQP